MQASPICVSGKHLYITEPTMDSLSTLRTYPRSHPRSSSTSVKMCSQMPTPTVPSSLDLKTNGRQLCPLQLTASKRASNGNHHCSQNSRRIWPSTTGDEILLPLHDHKAVLMFWTHPIYPCQENRSNCFCYRMSKCIQYSLKHY